MKKDESFINTLSKFYSNECINIEKDTIKMSCFYLGFNLLDKAIISLLRGNHIEVALSFLLSIEEHILINKENNIMVNKIFDSAKKEERIYEYILFALAKKELFYYQSVNSALKIVMSLFALTNNNTFIKIACGIIIFSCNFLNDTNIINKFKPCLS